jgi:glycosyltransferase involved in cell wall biosynthesis
MSLDVSVLMPFRDAAATLEEAADSLLGEPGVSLELVLVDDGSRDGGGELAGRLAARHRGVRLLGTPGTGIPAALNLGLAAAAAPLIARMDADDISLPGRLARQRAVLDTDPRLAVVGAQVEAFPSNAVGLGLALYVQWQNAVIDAADHARELFIEAPLCHPSVMLRRSALDLVGGYREVPWAEDYDLWLRLDAAGFGLAKVPEVLLRWRHRPGRATFSHDRYALPRFYQAKAPFLAARLRPLLDDGQRQLVVWGAGPTGKHTARALEPCGMRATLFVDIDPRKIGRPARGVPIVAPSALERQRHAVVVAVGARGARALIRAHLATLGFIEGADFVCAA